MLAVIGVGADGVAVELSDMTVALASCSAVLEFDR
jgi:hypothetical protein